MNTLVTTPISFSPLAAAGTWRVSGSQTALSDAELLWLAVARLLLGYSPMPVIRLSAVGGECGLVSFDAWGP